MKIVWTEPALKDMEEIHAFISRDDPQAAQRVLLHIHDRVEAHVVRMPHIGRPGRVANTREFVVTGPTLHRALSNPR